MSYVEKRKSIFNKLWIEKYRPIKLSQVIIDNETRKSFQEMIDNKEVPHLLLTGRPGTGKTTIAFILINEIIQNPEQDVLELNGSVARGIDIIRNTIEEYCKAPPSFGDKIKIVFIDEADKLTNDAQDALRNIVETYSRTTRFIFTCNYLHKISDALKSRLQTYTFRTLPKDNIYQIVSNILQLENVVFTPNDLNELINLTYPDIRKLINELQKYVLKNENSGVKQLTIRQNDGSYFFAELEIKDKILQLWYNVANQKANNLPMNINQNDVNYLLQKINESEFDYVTLYRILYDSINGLGVKAIISKYANQTDKVIFQDMNLIQMVYEVITNIISG